MSTAANKVHEKLVLADAKDFKLPKVVMPSDAVYCLTTKGTVRLEILSALTTHLLLFFLISELL